MTSPALFSSARQSWNTPACVLDRVRRIGPIALDPCSNAGSIVGAARAFTEAEDGLAQDWTERTAGGLVYVNPPYSRALPVWAAKCAEEAARGAEIVLLCPARPDTRWWFSSILAADALCFVRGRLRFLGASSGAPFPSSVVYYGPRSARFRAAFESAGWVVCLKG